MLPSTFANLDRKEKAFIIASITQLREDEEEAMKKAEEKAKKK